MNRLLLAERAARPAAWPTIDGGSLRNAIPRESNAWVGRAGGQRAAAFTKDLRDALARRSSSPSTSTTDPDTEDRG
jgi:hypothetical protein